MFKKVSLTHCLESHTRKASSHCIITSQFVVKLWKIRFTWIITHTGKYSWDGHVKILRFSWSNIFKHIILRQKHIIEYNLSSLIHLKDVVDHQPHTDLNIFLSKNTHRIFIRFSQPWNALSAQTLFEYPCQCWNIIFFIIITFTLYWGKEKSLTSTKSFEWLVGSTWNALKTKLWIFFWHNFVYFPVF